MAIARLSSSTTTSIVWVSSSMTIRTDLGGLKGTDHELGGILVPGHDVDAFAAEFVRHGIDAGAAHAYAGADRIDAAVAGVDGDLGARPDHGRRT